MSCYVDSVVYEILQYNIDSSIRQQTVIRKCELVQMLCRIINGVKIAGRWSKVFGGFEVKVLIFLVVVVQYS